MNNDINNTLQALVPILQMNGENVQSIEAVQEWYNINGTEYMKEVAEITYTSGYRKYADIGCDANLTAVYDVMAVLQEIKPCSKCVGRIVRGVYDMPAVEHPDINVGNMDTISRKAAIDAVFSEPLYEPGLKKRDADVVVPSIYEKIKSLPPAQPESKELSEWKADFKGYINALILPKDDYDGIIEYIDEVPHAQPERIKGHWIAITSWNNTYKCSVCGRLLVNITDGKNKVAKNYPYCHCGADMRGEQE